MKKVILLCAMFLVCPIIFAQNDKNNEREVYISEPSYYGQFHLVFYIIENGRIVEIPGFWIKYNKKGLKKIVRRDVAYATKLKFSYIENGNIYSHAYRSEIYNEKNFNNIKHLKPKEVFLMACPNFFEMTNEERLQYFLDHMEK